MVDGCLPERGQILEEFAQERPYRDPHPLNEKGEHVQETQLKMRNTYFYPIYITRIISSHLVFFIFVFVANYAGYDTNTRMPGRKPRELTSQYEIETLSPFLACNVSFIRVVAK